MRRYAYFSIRIRNDYWYFVYYMRRLFGFIVVVQVLAFGLLGCNSGETYADQKAREKSQIDAFISEFGIDVITMEEFLKDTITDNPETGPDKTRNEFVLFPDNGVYMQILRRGEGEPLKSGESKLYNCRFLEYNLAARDTLYMNLFDSDPDIMTCTRNGGMYSATFKSGRMNRAYGSSVPSGWLVPMPYIKPAFYNGSSSARVNLIVPHNQGTNSAANTVTPFFYELLIMTQKWQ